MFFEHKITKIMKSDWGDWKRVSCHGNQIFFPVGVSTSFPGSFFPLSLRGGEMEDPGNEVVGVLPVEVLHYQFSMVSAKR